MANNGPSAYLMTKLLQHVFKLQSYSPTGGVYMALGTAKPDPSNGTYWENEFRWPDDPENRGYKRAELSFSKANSPNETGSQTFLTSVCVFPRALQNWGAAGWCSIWDSIDGGNMLYYAPCGGASILRGQSARVPAGGVYFHEFGSNPLREHLLDMVLRGGSVTIGDIKASIQDPIPIPSVLCSTWGVGGWSADEGVLAFGTADTGFAEITQPGVFAIGRGVNLHLGSDYYSGGATEHVGYLHTGDTPVIGTIEIQLTYFPE